MSKTLLNRIAAITLLICTCCGTLVAGTVLDRTIAKINDDILTESDLAEIQSDAAGKFNVHGVDGFSGATSETVAGMLDKALLLQEAKRLKISPSADEMNRQVEGMVRDIRANFSSEKDFHQALASERISLDQLKQELIKKTKTDFMVYHVVNSRYSVSDDEVEKFQQEHKAQGESVASYHLRRLGIPVRKNKSSQETCREVRDIVAQIITEGISFEEGIRKYSQIPGAQLDAGDMGYMTADKLNADVRAAVENLETGQASVPVIAGGFANIFYLEGKRGARSAVREQKFFDTREELLKELRHKANLQIFDKRLLPMLPDEYRSTVVSGGSFASKQPGEASAQGTPSQYREILLQAPDEKRSFPATNAPAGLEQTPSAESRPTPQSGGLRRLFRSNK